MLRNSIQWNQPGVISKPTLWPIGRQNDWMNWLEGLATTPPSWGANGAFYAASWPLPRFFHARHRPILIQESVAVFRSTVTGGGCGKYSTWPVCSKPKGNTTHGICDIVGNVSVWIQDAYELSYEGAPNDGTAREGPNPNRVVRGNSWNDFAHGFRWATFRNYFDPPTRSVDFGIRLAKSIH